MQKSIIFWQIQAMLNNLHQAVQYIKKYSRLFQFVNSFHSLATLKYFGQNEIKYLQIIFHVYYSFPEQKDFIYLVEMELRSTYIQAGAK